MWAAWNVCLLSKKKSLSNSQDAKLRLLKNKTAGGKLQFCHYNVQHVVWALEVKLELGWRFWVSRHAYSRFVPRPALFAVRSTNCRECRVWNTNSIILAPWAFGAWRDFFGVYNPVTCCKSVLLLQSQHSQGIFLDAQIHLSCCLRQRLSCCLHNSSWPVFPWV